MNLINIDSWYKKKFSKPLIIAGPCSAETENQLVNTAVKISEIGKVDIFRAGLWKPRTQPNNFEGVGEIGLKWLKKVKKQTGLLTTVEVATPEHVEKCLKAENSVDMFWIGARTIANPFSVQELAASVKGVDIPVFVKNPLNPDLSLWIGALERFNKAGIKKLAAIHRGFYPFERGKLRNVPKWEIVIELKIKYPNLPIICDPSHIAGKIDYIEDISQKALDLNFNGLMIETHFCPEEALSDSKQQLTPEQLRVLLDKLKLRKPDILKNEEINILEQYRDQIDSIDYQLLELLSKRLRISEKIGEYKFLNEITILQLRRWKDILKTRTEFGKKIGINEEFIKNLLEIVHKESISVQNDIMNKKK